MKKRATLCAVCASLLPSCCLTKPPVVETTSLRDAVIAAAKEAKAAGAKTLQYEASITTTSKGEVSVVIPLGAYAPSFGGSVQQAVGSKVVITVEIDSTARKQPSGVNYLLDTRTLEATPLE